MTSPSLLQRCLALSALTLGAAILPVQAATFTVTTTADSGPGTLRQAILDANTSRGADTINFALPSGPQIIELTSAGNDAGNGDLSAFLVAGDLTIEGPGADKLTVKRSAAQNTAEFRLFKLASGFKVNIRGLTLSNGVASSLTKGGLTGVQLRSFLTMVAAFTTPAI